MTKQYIGRDISDKLYKETGGSPYLNEPVAVKLPPNDGTDDPDDPVDPDTGDGQDTPPADGLTQEQIDSILDYVTERSRKGAGFMLGKLWVSNEALLLALNLLVAVIGVIVVSTKKR